MTPYLKLDFYFSCNHEIMKRADACILDLISEKNPEHFFVATQEYDLRKKSQEVVCMFYYLLIGCQLLLYRIIF